MDRILMLKVINLPESLLNFIAHRPGAELSRIRSEASRRCFYRISWGRKSLVAMVYPEPSRLEVDRFRTVQEIYRNHGLRVPGIEAILDDQVVIQEDAGDLLLQRAWRANGMGECRRLLSTCRDILDKLAAVPPALATARLDRARQNREMDFFLLHFSPRYPVPGVGEAELQALLAVLVENIEPECFFAHRDFHSRNLLIHGGEIVMVDFQDSLLAPRHYDLVSLAFDSYLDLGRFRELLLSGHESATNELRQLRLTALQRN
ncbi:MAG: phosphotransferase, partial [Candidatus Aminicenantes bacterium]|nr:phosphotransferase [Candidatus Aminicenantes bacterium]